MVKTRSTAAVSDREFRAATARGSAKRRTGGFATSVRYDEKTRRVYVELTNGVLFAVPVATLPAIATASDRELARVELLGGGGALHWESLDADYSVTGLILDSVGTVAAGSVLGRSGGLAKTRAKVAAARANGKKGGRPRKKPSSAR